MIYGIPYFKETSTTVFYAQTQSSWTSNPPKIIQYGLAGKYEMEKIANHLYKSKTSDICSLELQVFAVLQRHPPLLRLLEDVKVNQLRPPPTPGWPALPNFTETRSAHSAMIDAISWAIWCTFSPRWYDSVWSCVNNLYLSEFHHNSQENFSHKLGPSCPNPILIQLRWRCHAYLPSCYCYSFEVTSSNVSSCDILSSKTAIVHSPELGPNCYIQ